jgi:hypothetical protein
MDLEEFGKHRVDVHLELDHLSTSLLDVRRNAAPVVHRASERPHVRLDEFYSGLRSLASALGNLPGAQDVPSLLLLCWLRRALLEFEPRRGNYVRVWSEAIEDIPEHRPELVGCAAERDVLLIHQVERCLLVRQGRRGNEAIQRRKDLLLDRRQSNLRRGFGCAERHFAPELERTECLSGSIDVGEVRRAPVPPSGETKDVLHWSVDGRHLIVADARVHQRRPNLSEPALHERSGRFAVAVAVHVDRVRTTELVPQRLETSPPIS